MREKWRNKKTSKFHCQVFTVYRRRPAVRAASIEVAAQVEAAELSTFGSATFKQTLPVSSTSAHFSGSTSSTGLEVNKLIRFIVFDTLFQYLNSPWSRYFENFIGGFSSSGDRF